MRINPPLRPITVDDADLLEFIRCAEIPPLLMAVAQLTGDLDVLPARPESNGWLLAPHGGLSAEQQARARGLAFEALRGLRDGSAAPAGADPVAFREIARWAIGSDVDTLLPLLREQMPSPGQDPGAPGWTMAELAPGADLTVTIIGAGMSGLLAAHRLSQAGVPFVVYEKNSGLGGTWQDNRYPGCRVDVASHLYNYSFATTPDWPDHFCEQEVVLGYLEEFARRHDLLRHIRFDSEVTAARWDDARLDWRVSVRGPDGVHTTRSTVVVSAVGQLSRPHIPDLPGRATFAGPAFHSARWDHSVSLAGRRVGVIGTGASAYQFVPEIAGETAQLTVFQRTPPWLRPTPNYHDPVSAGARWLFEHVPYYQSWHRFWLFAPGLQLTGGILDGWVVDPAYPPTERAVSAHNDELRAALTRWMSAQLADSPELRAAVIPRYPVGAKRVFRDNGAWLRTLRAPHVELVTDPIAELTPGGVRTADGRHHALDVLVYGTGFQGSRFLAPMTVTGRGGLDLHAHWDGDARAYLGCTVPQFPNLFCLYGPNTNLSGQGGSIFFFSECGVGYLLDAIRVLLQRGCRAFDVRRDVHDRYNAWVDAGNARRAWGFSGVSSWFINDKGRTAQNWPFSAHEYWTRTRAFDPADYHLLDRQPSAADTFAEGARQ
ncbi:NAD(P)-binding protein [Nocardia sp. NPDC057353]|uniref:flavin-containing monooxygenase n=1 Tax=Nocardia sp. NPDC057353 TaxID=3346104 RepID=UPI0036372240